jgi:aspartyl-tRNA(Asn)/glutamyl-tRNA(Gln) amidotransferase subunit B
MAEEVVKVDLGEFYESPLECKKRFMAWYGLTDHQAEMMTSDREIANYFQEAVLRYVFGKPKVVANWIINGVMRILKACQITADKLGLTPRYLVDVIRMVDDGTISKTTGKSLLMKVHQQNSRKASDESISGDS